MTVGPDPADARSKPPERNLIVRLTTAGRVDQLGPGLPDWLTSSYAGLAEEPP